MDETPRTYSISVRLQRFTTEETCLLQQDGLITWRGFAQPFRPQRDYATFGPIVFQRSQYERAVRRAVADATAIE